MVERAGLEAVPTDPGTDHAGASTPSWAVGEVVIQIGGLQLRVSDVVAIDGPSQFDDWGLGGFLSPQHLHPSAWVVIDLVSDQMGLVEGDTAEISEWLGESFLDLKSLSLVRESPELPIVRAAIQPFPPVATMLNTATENTEVARSVVPGLRGSAYRTHGRGVSGSGVEAQELIDQILEVGGVHFEVPLLLLRDRMPDPPAMIGMDLLAGSVLAIGPTAAEPILWLVAIQ